MKSFISKTMTAVVMLTALFAFSPKFGGEGFEILLNNKVVLQQFGKELNTVKSLDLSNLSASDKLSVRYHHCGQIGKNRVVTIKDGANTLIKEFRFADVSTAVGEMVINVKDIPGLNLTKTVTLKIYYRSTELPNGRQLATISTGHSIAAN